MPDDIMTPLKNAVRVFNKHVLNPAMTLAGRKHWYAAVIRHTGRRSGKSFATPVVADRVADGFILPLPYGTGVDWLRNVLAAGRASVMVGGETFDVTGPEVIVQRIGIRHCIARGIGDGEVRGVVVHAKTRVHLSSWRAMLRVHLRRAPCQVGGVEQRRDR